MFLLLVLLSYLFDYLYIFFYSNYLTTGDFHTSDQLQSVAVTICPWYEARTI